MVEYKDNRLFVKTKKGIIFDLKLTSRWMQLTGVSATGKTFLCNEIERNKRLLKTGVNVRSFDATYTELKDIDDIRDSLIVMDRSEFLADDVREHIILDRSNCYIFISRLHLGFGIPARDVVELVEENNKFIFQHSYVDFEG